MNEGKPGSPGQAPTVRPEGPDGDFELARPEPARTGAGERHDGDYELGRPLRGAAGTGGAAEPAPSPAADAPRKTHTTDPAPPAGPAAPAGTDTPGDFGTPTAPGSPAPEAGPTAPAAPLAGAEPVSPGTPVAGTAPAVADGAVAQARPAVPADPAPEADPAPRAPVPAVGTGPSDGSASSSAAPADTVPPVDAALPAAVTGPVPVDPSLPPAAPGAGAGQPTPLHDPDPYSTPPYGEPGPWAPAPPVQHPAAPAATAHGMPVTAPPAAQDTTPHGAPPPAPVTAPLPAQAPPAAPPADPWRRYDPWAAATAAPLQQTGSAGAGRERPRGRGKRALLGAALVLALVCGGAGGIVGAYLERNGGVGTVELPQAGREDPGRETGTVAGIAAQALPSVVTLHVSGSGEAGTGTGFVLDTHGHVLTNDHVVEPAGDDGEITVTFHSGDTAEATVVGRDSGYDLAVVKVKGVRGLTPLPLGNSDNVQVGDPVVAIGAPFDLAGTVTSGIISAKERPITAGGEKGDGSDVSYVDALQTDAPINPGNSGGPLLDARARVIGINSAIRSAGSGAEPDGGQAGSIGLGFAIPVNQGKRVAEELINTGRATHPVIGITLDMGYTGDGARVGSKGSDGGPAVSAGGPGARAGIRSGDVITEVDGRRVHSGEELIVKTRAHRPGDRLELTLERDGEERKVSLVLGSSGGD